MSQPSRTSRSRRRVALAVSLLVAAAAMAVGAGPARGAATVTVNKIGDQADLNLTNAKCDVSTKTGNQCTLRAAIQEANDTPGSDTINFNIASTATTKVITPATPLPPITQPVTINGYSQTGTSTNTRAVGNDAVLKIVLDGINAGADTVGLSLEGSGSVVRGLVVQRFDGTGIVVTGTGHSINGNFIGTTASGATARGNAIGVGVSGADHVIGGSTAAARNVISGNEREGVKLVSATNVTVIENYIGVMDSGAEALGNGEFGVRILQGGNNRIGQAGDGNVISGNGSDGVHISFTVGNLVQGNRIGTNAAGTAAIANGGAGVQLSSTDDNDVGGAAAGAGNVISGNAEQGVLIVAGANDNFLARNLIGTKADGTGDLGNSLDGVRIESLSNIVGATGGAGNLIVGNGNNGVLLIGDEARSNVIRSNNITANDQHGVLARKGPNDVLGNVIVGNFEAGVLVLSSASRVKIMGNQIFANGELGIDLAGGPQFGSGVTVNDTDDPDRGSNGLQNFPVLTSAVKSHQTNITTVAGSLNSNVSTAFTIELFRVLADSSGYGEGLELIGSKQITTSSGGDRNFTFVVGTLALGEAVTATATSAAGNTSEFAKNVTVVPGQ